VGTMAFALTFCPAPAHCSTLEDPRDKAHLGTTVIAAKPVAHGAAQSQAHAADHSKDARVAPDVALRRLIDGNRRYAKGAVRAPNRDLKRRAEVAKGQHPFAIIVTCSDSRVPPEILFDQGLGDLFVVRVAGNVVDDIAIGSIEYAVEHLGARLILVLGHEKCGAVSATVQGGSVPGHIGSIVDAIKPAVEHARTMKGTLLDNAISENARAVAAKLSSSEPILMEMVKSGKIQVANGVYSLTTGAVAIHR